MNANLAAFLQVIRHCEGTADPDGYRRLFGGRLFDSYADHPRVVVSASGYKSTAAGAYQALARTWDDFIKAKGPHDFSPASQDEFALWCITRRKAMDDVLAGRLKAAITKCSNEWASLPSSPYGQPTRTMEYCEDVYRRAGGFLRPVPDTVGVSKPPAEIPPVSRAEPAELPQNPQSYRSSTAELPQPRTAMDPISLVSILTSAFAPLIRAKVEKAVGSDVGKPLADNLLALAQTATGKTDPLEAVAVARQDPAVVAKLEQSAVDWLAQVAPLLDKIDGYERAQQVANAASADAAGERGRKDAVDLAPQIVRYMFAIVAGALLFLFFVMGVQAWSLTTHEPTTAMLTLVGPLLGGIFGSLATIVAYRFGEKRNSSAAEASQAIAYKLAERP